MIFFALFCNFLFISSNVSNLCFGHILLLKWNISYPSMHSSFNFWKTLTAHAIVFTITRVLLYSSVFSKIKSLKFSSSIPPGHRSVSSIIVTRLNAPAYCSKAPAISRHSQTLFSWSAASVGCVAEHNTTVVLQKYVRKFTARLKSSVHLTGNACTSSKMIMLLHRLCILRILPFWLENSVFKICTAVVTIIGTSHVSVRLWYFSSSPSSQITLQWCSRTAVDIPVAFRISSAFCSKMELNGAI